MKDVASQNRSEPKIEPFCEAIIAKFVRALLEPELKII